MDEKIRAALSVLGFKDSYTIQKVPKMKEVTKKFHKLALANHPDKGGDEEVCKKVTEAYRLVGDLIEKQKNDIPADDLFDFEEDVAMKTFEQFKANVKQNMKSFTIQIENSTSFAWEVILTKHFGSPMDRKSNGLHWSVKKYSDGNIVGNVTIGKWHKPKKDNQSKLHIQSNEAGNYLPAHFVDHELPKLFEEVSKYQEKPSVTRDRSSASSKAKTPLKKLTKPRTSILKTFKCNKCEFRTNVSAHLVKHNRSTHEAKSTQSKTSDKEPEVQECSSLLLKFHCMMCRKGFVHESELTLHEKDVHELKCDHCESAFYTESELNLHVLANHTSNTASKTLFQELIQAGEIPLVKDPCDVFVDCNSCSTVLEGDENQKRHMLNDHETRLPYNCDKCKFTTNEEVVLKHHTLMMHVPGFECHECRQMIFPDDLVVGCENCEFFYHKRCTNLKHLQHDHETLKTWRCHNCSQDKILELGLEPATITLDETSDEIIVPEILATDSSLKCKNCLATFDDEKALNDHRHVHSKEESSCHACDISIKDNLFLTCDTCDYKFHKKCTSLKSATGAKWKPKEWHCGICRIADYNEPTNTNVFKFPNFGGKHRKPLAAGGCDHPDIEFLESQINTLKSVIARRELELKKVQESDNLKAKKIMNLEAQLSEARKAACQTESFKNVTNDNNLKCQETARINNLEIKTNHLEHQLLLLSSKLEASQHNNERYNCKTCGKAFNYKKELEQHMLVHTPLLNCHVHDCDFETHNLSDLETHKAKHTPQLSCKECAYKTNSTEDLVSHQSSHITILPCTKCNYRTINNSDLAQHMKIHSLKCDECSYYAIHLKDLNRHKRTMHCVICDMCDYKTNNQDRLKKHKEDQHIDNAPSTSDDCAYNNSNKTSLQEHQLPNHGQRQRTRIFSARRYSTSNQPKQHTTSSSSNLFRPWSPSTTRGAIPTPVSSTGYSSSFPRPFISNSTTLPEGFLSQETANNNL